MTKEELVELLCDLLDEDTPQVCARPCASLSLEERDRLNTGNPADQVYTRDLFTLGESPRLGAGLMEMRRTTFPWKLNYDEIDYIIEGSLTVEHGGRSVTAGPGQTILIPKGSKIHFSAPEYAKFLYVTYPADWQNAPK